MTSKEDLDHCVEAYMNVYSVLKLCVDVEGQLRSVQYYCVAWCLGCLLKCIL